LALFSGFFAQFTHTTNSNPTPRALA